jgi:hypothetical protein
MSEDELSDKATQPKEGFDANSSEDSNAILPTGRRFALRNVRKQLTDEELAQLGTLP